MKEKSAFYRGWIQFWRFIASLFCDQGGNMSQKRVIPLITMIYFCKMLEANIKSGYKPDDYLLYACVAIVLGGIGLSIPEWFSPKARTIKDKEGNLELIPYKKDPEKTE